MVWKYIKGTKIVSLNEIHRREALNEPAWGKGQRREPTIHIGEKRYIRCRAGRMPWNRAIYDDYDKDSKAIGGTSPLSKFLLWALDSFFQFWEAAALSSVYRLGLSLTHTLYWSCRLYKVSASGRVSAYVCYNPKRRFYVILSGGLWICRMILCVPWIEGHLECQAR